MSNLKWHSGPPPHVGWWATGWTDACTLWRWWDGDQWSIATLNTESATVAKYYAALPSGIRLSEIVWCDYWPENARVPRIDPR